MTVHRLRTRVDRAADLELDRLRGRVLAAEGLSPDARRRMAQVLDRERASRSGWAFVMINVDLFGAVLDHLLDTQRRPKCAARLWTRLFSYLPPDTNEVLATRTEIARDLGIPASVVSEIMLELERVGAVYTRREGRGVRYFVHPKLGTHLKGAARDEAQSSAPPLKLRVVREPDPAA